MSKKIICIIGVAFLIFDQISKKILINKIIIIIPGIFSINYTKNTGIAFSMFSNNTKIVTIIIIIILILIIKYIKDNIKIMNNKEFCFLLFILVGGISNLIDRIFRGYVIDYIKINIFSFPVFNIADVLIITGVVFLTINNILRESNKERKEEM